MTENIRRKALDALDGMAYIVRRERLVREDYISQEIDHEVKRSGAICGGHNACAIGSLWLGYGVRPEKTFWDDNWFLPGASQEERSVFIRRRPALKVALDALNQSALAFCKRRNIDPEYDLDSYYTDPEYDLDSYYTDPIEALFESTDPDGEYLINNHELLRIVNGAKQRVRKAK